MRIISKKHDYYDKVMIHGADPTVVFNRKPVEHKDLAEFSQELDNYFRSSFKLTRGGYRSPDLFAVIFCGRIYRGIRIHTRRAANWLIDVYDETYCYNTEETMKIAKDKKIDMDQGCRNRVYIDGKYVKIPIERRVEMFFEDVGSDKFMSLMIEKRCSILLIERTSVYNLSLRAVENPTLKKVAFFKAIDPYTAYQQLSMFIGGILPKETMPLVEISDEDMIVKKGFDKWSFRRMKGDK